MHGLVLQVSLGSLSVATAVAVDAVGDVFIGDQSLHEVVEVPASNLNSQIVVYSPGGSFEPGGLAIDAAGDLYIADNGEAKVLEIPGRWWPGRHGGQRMESP